MVGTQLAKCSFLPLWKNKKIKKFRHFLVGRMETRKDTQSWEHRKDFYFSPYVFDWEYGKVEVKIVNYYYVLIIEKYDGKVEDNFIIVLSMSFSLSFSSQIWRKKNGGIGLKTHPSCPIFFSIPFQSNKTSKKNHFPLYFPSPIFHPPSFHSNQSEHNN